jgi:oligopeptide transport system permease protein
MLNYILKRVVLIFFTGFIILSLTFILMKLLPFPRPIGPVEVTLPYFFNQVRQGYFFLLPNNSANELIADIRLVDENNVYLFKQVPVITQYFNWLANVFLRWDWGTSTAISVNVPAIEIIARKLPYTIRLNFIAIFTSVPFGLILGIIAALKKNTRVDYSISTLIMVFISVPSFVVISLLMGFFAYNLRILPSQWPPDSAPLFNIVLGFVIPVSALSFGTIAGFARVTRAELTEIISSDFLLLARTKGLTKSQAVVRHALRNSLVPLVPSIIGQFIGILSGSIVLERLYGIPGIGDLFINAINLKDYNVVMVDMAIFVIIGLFATLLVDLSYGIVDPRIRMGAKK